MREISFLLFLGCVAGGCDNSQAMCQPLIGTYSGTLTGTAPFNGTITLVLTDEAGGNTDPRLAVNGTWSGQGDFFGKINTSLVDCASGILTSPFGLALTSPEPMTLGPLTGTFTQAGGTGSFEVDSGAAQTAGITGRGNWTVAR